MSYVPAPQPEVWTHVKLDPSCGTVTTLGFCSACGRWRPVYPEPDRSEVCLDCYEERNGAVL